ncbi:alpha-tocopherol transfer protein-like isoform X1 [Dermacentor variabilis]|uniref:alpha-tocopherol transfer protein-like isoform X1 n=1 Tax=Dermacentor variabilis TaxID=34621 RepID=UPI003F5C4222
MKEIKKSASTDASYTLQYGTTSSLKEMTNTKQDATLQLRELIAGETQLRCPTNDDFLVKFLRARNYNVECSFKNVKNYFKVRSDCPEIFDRLDPDSVFFDTICREHKLVTVSRKKDPKGRAVILLNLGAWSTSICSLNDFFRAGIVHVEHVLHDEEVQTNGVVFVMDFKNLGIYHLTQFTPPVIKRLFRLLQDCYPLRIKGIYVINNPPLFDILFTIAKHFMKAKLVSRTVLFGTDWKKLRCLVPDDVISEEGGGTLGIYDYDAMERNLKRSTEYFREMSSCGYLHKPNVCADSEGSQEEEHTAL